MNPNLIESAPPEHESLPTAIVSRPGIMQQSLRALLAACPPILVVASLGDGLSALNYAAAHRPGLLVIDCNLLREEVEALLAGVRTLQLPTRCLVLTRSHQQGAWAQKCGADATVAHDASLGELQAALAQMHVSAKAQSWQADAEQYP